MGVLSATVEALVMPQRLAGPDPDISVPVSLWHNHDERLAIPQRVRLAGLLVHDVQDCVGEAERLIRCFVFPISAIDLNLSAPPAARLIFIVRPQCCLV